MGARRRQGGYTLIEVLASMAVLGTGLLGIIALQGAAVTANQRAQELTTATNVARRWQERLRRDAMQWTSPSQENPTSNIGNTWYLRPLATATSTNWVLPEPPSGVVASLESTASDFWGNDVAANSPDAYFCTHVRLTQLIANELVRAEVRVWWYRHGGVRPAEYAGCGAAALNTMGVDTTNVHWVHLSQAIARHQQ
ncbi:MAG: prepilin-type N-terminal cleavage/methylation domain-containing protein [Polyangiales bacterium]